MFECDITLQGLEVIFAAYSLFCVELLGQDALENDSRESDESESYYITLPSRKQTTKTKKDEPESPRRISCTLRSLT